MITIDDIYKTDPKDIYKRIKYSIEAAGMTRWSFVKAVGLSQGGCLYGCGCWPKSSTLLLVAKNCNVSMEWLLTGEGAEKDG